MEASIGIEKLMNYLWIVEKVKVDRTPRFDVVHALLKEVQGGRRDEKKAGGGAREKRQLIFQLMNLRMERVNVITSRKSRQ